MNTTMLNPVLKKRSKILVYFLAGPEEEDECQAIRKHLSPAIRNSKVPIEICSDFEIPAGEDIQKHKRKLLEADIVLALISADFINDDEIYARNQKVIERHNNHETILMPILVRNCLWKSTPFVNLHLLPRNFQPLNNKQFWNSEDDALMAVVTEIYESISEFSNEDSAQPAATPEFVNPPVQKAVPVATPNEPPKVVPIAQAVSETRGTPGTVFQESKPVIEPELKPAEPVQQFNNKAYNQDYSYTNRQTNFVPIEVDWRKQYYKNVLGKRAMAFFLDNFLVLFPSFLVLGIILAPFLPEGELPEEQYEMIGYAAFIFYFVVCAALESSGLRGTFGKRIMKLQITDKQGHPVSFFRALGRNLLRAVVGYSYILVVPLLIQVFVFTKTKKLFHDQLSRTIIGEKLDG